MVVGIFKELFLDIWNMINNETDSYIRNVMKNETLKLNLKLFKNWK